MKNLNKNLEIWFYTMPFAISWLLLVHFSDTPTFDNYETIKKIPDAVMYATFFYLFFSKYLWKIPIFHNWLVPYPNLQGTWEGVLKSTWKNLKTKKAQNPIPVKFSIKQDFENINISMYTKESVSFSKAAKFTLESNNTISLSYTYGNKPKATVRDRSEIHDGAACLQFIESEVLTLEGEYWTSRKTTGDIAIRKTSDQLTHSFTDKNL